MKRLTPNLMVENVNETMEFYTNVLGFEKVAIVPEEGTFDWAMMKCGAVEIMVQSRSSLGTDLPQLGTAVPPGPLTLYIDVENVPILRQQIDGKVTMVKDVQTTFYGTTEFTIQDCNGFLLTFAQGGA
jgi:lactoylglutathione lyase